MLKKKVTIMLCFVLFFAAALVSQSAPGTRGFDFVVIVDQSGSMSGTKGLASDKLGVRNDMVKRTFDILAKDGILNKVTHRFGVISFGDTVRVDLPLSQITPTTVDRLRSRLESSLNDRSMGSTHFSAAFEAVGRMFAAKPLAEPGKRVIVLITDGAPYIEGIQISSYVRDLRELVSSSFPPPDYQLHVIALNDPSSNYWEQYGEFWKELSHNHEHKLKGDKEEIFTTLHKVIDNIIGSPGEPITQTEVVMPPYLESVVFSIFQVETETVVKIISADNHKQPISDKDDNVAVVNVGNTIRTITIKNPKPGIWEILKSKKNASVNIYLQRFFPRGTLLHPAPGDSIKQFQKVRVKYRVENGEHKPLNELPGYPLTLELSLVKPDSSRVQMKMEKSSNPSEKSIYETTGEIECDLPGTYKVEILIATKDLKNRQVTLFRDQYSKFQVSGARLIKANLLSPEPLENISLYRRLIFLPNRMLFTFKFEDEEGNSLNLPAFFGNSHKDDILTVYNVNENGEEPVPMTFRFKEDGLLIGEPDGLTNPGKYHLKFRPNNSVVPSHYTLRISPDHLFFSRNLGIHNWLQIVLLAILLLSLTVFLVYSTYLNLRFPLKGVLYIDRLGDRSIAEFPLTRRRHRVTLTAFPNETMINKITVKAVRSKTGGVNVIKVIGNVKNKKELFLKERILSDRGSATLKHVPYVLRYRLK